MQSKMLIAGVVAAIGGVWLLVSWEPISREHQEASPSASTSLPEPQPDMAASPGTQAANAPPTAARPPAPTPAADDSEGEVHYERTASGEIKSDMPLEQIPDEALDPANMQPPASSGPLAQLKTDFESSARDANSGRSESTIESAFHSPNVPKELFDAAVCHGSVCRAHMRWTRERAGGFMLAMITLTSKPPDQPGAPPPFSKDFAIGKAAERNSNGERELDVYFRKQPDPQ